MLPSAANSFTLPLRRVYRRGAAFFLTSPEDSYSAPLASHCRPIRNRPRLLLAHHHTRQKVHLNHPLPSLCLSLCLSLSLSLSLSHTHTHTHTHTLSLSPLTASFCIYLHISFSLSCYHADSPNCSPHLSLPLPLPPSPFLQFSMSGYSSIGRRCGSSYRRVLCGRAIAWQKGQDAHRNPHCSRRPFPTRILHQGAPSVQHPTISCSRRGIPDPSPTDLSLKSPHLPSQSQPQPWQSLPPPPYSFLHLLKHVPVNF